MTKDELKASIDAATTELKGQIKVLSDLTASLNKATDADVTMLEDIKTVSSLATVQVTLATLATSVKKRAAQRIKEAG